MSDWLDAEALAGRAMDLFESGRIADAEASLRRAIDIDDRQPGWHHHLGVMQMIADRVGDAVVSFDRAAELDPGATEHLEAAAGACVSGEDFEGAATRLKRVLEIDSGDEDVWARLISAHAAGGRHDEAETTFYLAEMHLGHVRPGCLTAMAESLCIREVWPRARWCLEEAIRIEPDRSEALKLLADVHMATGHLDEALQVFERLIEASPVDASMAIAWSDLLARVGREADAAGVLRRVLDADPANPEVHYRLGVASAAQGRYQQAALAFQLVRRLDRTHPRCDRDLAACLLHLGQVGDAQKLLSLVVARLQQADPAELKREQDEALIDLGRLLIRADLPVEATVVFEIASDRHQGSAAPIMRELARSRYLAGDLDGGRAISRRVLRIEPTCVASLCNLAMAALRRGRLVEAAGWVKRGLAAHPGDEMLRRVRTRIVVRRVGEFLCRLAGVEGGRHPGRDRTGPHRTGAR